MFNSTAIAQLGQPHTASRFFVFLDFDGDPVRVTTWHKSLTLSGTGDADLDGFTFDAFDPTVITVSEVQHSVDGAESVTASMSGLPVANADLLDILGDESKWRLRRAKLWLGVADATLTAQGNIVPYYLGRMVSYNFPQVGADSQTVEIVIESYRTILSGATGRTYMSQSIYDSGDRSAEVATSTGRIPASAQAVANGAAQGGVREFNANVRLL